VHIPVNAIGHTIKHVRHPLLIIAQRTLIRPGEMQEVFSCQPPTWQH
jgi:hypothetical protein